jgi:hypothetical protein
VACYFFHPPQIRSFCFTHDTRHTTTTSFLLRWFSDNERSPSFFHHSSTKFFINNCLLIDSSGKRTMTALPSFSVSKLTFLVALIASFSNVSEAFVSPNQKLNTARSSLDGRFAVYGVLDKMSEMFAELDAFVDDATSRRLGAGSSFYGKRKSNFYGADDKGRKKDKSVPDPTGE